MKKLATSEIAEQPISTKNIFQRINGVMKEVSYVQKEDKKVNNQYRFVSHDQVTAALNGPLAKHGIVILPSILELTQDGNKTVVKLEVAFVNIDNPTDQFKVIHYGYGIDPSDKGVGKAVSYACKYAMLKTFCLETGDDPERDNYEHVPASANDKPMSTYMDELSQYKRSLYLSCNDNEKTTVEGYVKALESHYIKEGDTWPKVMLEKLQKMNGTIKAKAMEWSIKQATA